MLETSARAMRFYQKPCVESDLRYYGLMPLTNLTVAEEALALSPDERAALARLLIQSLEADPRTDSEIKTELKSRLEDLLSKQDQGLDFSEVFGASL
jgi:putative addiction module component (TIGR02574 family)